MTSITTPGELRLVDAKALAELLSTSVRTVWRLRAAGLLPRPVRIAGSVRWRRSDVELWLELECPNQSEFEIRKKVGRPCR